MFFLLFLMAYKLMNYTNSIVLHTFKTILNNVFLLTLLYLLKYFLRNYVQQMLYY